MSLTDLRETIRDLTLVDEAILLERLQAEAGISAELRARAVVSGAGLVRSIREDSAPGLMEVFLAEYGLSTSEGVALMCLAEALLRVPDADTIDALIEDKIAPSDWGVHLGKSSSSLVNASTWALMLTGKVLKDGQGVAATLKGAVKRLGEPVIRGAVSRAMREMGAQFVLGETIDAAVVRGAKQVARGYSYSFDMLGEAALTADDADDFMQAYRDAITRLAREAKADSVAENPGISIKLSALHPRYEVSQQDRVMAELVPRALELALQARAAGIGLNVDAEEADRLDLSLDVIEAVLRDERLAGWDGFGVVVQAYGKRASLVIDWLAALAETLDRRIMVRLVKGAYWDTEIKRAQVEGLTDFPVFTRKDATDVSYLCCAQRLLARRDRVYPQFATHNAHTVAAVLEMAGEQKGYEFQRLHGMGEALHDLVLARSGVPCRIYAPVGAHRDLLAYLVRRLLENGANSSFVNQVVDESVPAEIVAADPFSELQEGRANSAVVAPSALYTPSRPNSLGWDLRDPRDLMRLEKARAPFAAHQWSGAPMIAGDALPETSHEVVNPANPEDLVGAVAFSSQADIATALDAALPWSAPVSERAATLNRAADLLEDRAGEIFALLAREAGKTLPDCVGELREGVDFMRYYAARASTLADPARGIFACISPWNFPLAIFLGQISASLAAGNGVLAKPAESTSLVACFAVKALLEAGVPRAVLQLLPGLGATVGAALTCDVRVKGVCFTGSTETAQTINRSMAKFLAPTAPLIAETGGLNAMIVDSTALPEQAVQDIVASAFQSAGQRCSALRMLYVQEDVADTVLTMLYGAMDELRLGAPWALSTDVGPVIDAAAMTHIETYVAQGKVLKVLDKPQVGTFVAPVVLQVSGIADLEREVFGPVLHVATYKAEQIDAVVDAINATGYGLTFGMHSRIDDRIAQVTDRLEVGNIYVNRNQIGAVVGTQPFGGEGLSGTGPKAGGPSYLGRFTQPSVPVFAQLPADLEVATVQAVIDEAARAGVSCVGSQNLPGPTGESNRLSRWGRGVILCLGPTAEAALDQAAQVRAAGAIAVSVAPGISGANSVSGVLDLALVGNLKVIQGVACWSDPDTLRIARGALAETDGPILPLMAEADIAARAVAERHICIDTTAAGGNASLLAAAS